MREGKQRERAVTHHVVNLLRKVKLPEGVVVKRVLNPGGWQGVCGSECRDSRSTLVEFANPTPKDRFLASADETTMTMRGMIITVPGLYCHKQDSG